MASSLPGQIEHSRTLISLRNGENSSHLNRLPREIRQVIYEEAALSGLNPLYAVSPDQEHEAVMLRRRIALRLTAIGKPLTSIGRWLGNRNHATIRHLLKTATPEERARAESFRKLTRQAVSAGFIEDEWSSGG